MPLARRSWTSLPRPVIQARLATSPLPPLDQAVPHAPGRYVSVAGVELFVRATPATRPDAEPALYVHGLGGSATNWTDLAGQLAGFLEGEAIDLPGFGRSGPPPRGDYSIRMHVRTVIRYLDQSGRGPVHLLGNSMGGAISLLVAAQRPDLVRTLSLVSPAVPDLRPQRMRANPEFALLFLPGIGGLAVRRMQQIPIQQRVQATIEMCFADVTRYPPDRLADAITEARGRMGMEWAGIALVRSLRGLISSYLVPGGAGMWARMSRITAPTLVVWGQHDRLVSVDLAPRVARTIPNSRLVIFPDTGHVTQMEDPVGTARAVLGLLEDTVGTGAAEDTGRRRAAHP
jgi:pimeloyl-ACP methyl ester carboxylesterase